MSQNDRKFQSKGKKFGGGGKDRGGPGGGGFGKKFEGDRGGARGGSYGRGGKSFGGDRKGGGKFEGRGGKPGYKTRDSGESRGFGGGEKPFRKPYRDRDAGGGGDRPFRKPYEKREGGGERRSFDKGGDRPYKKPYEKREGGFGGERRSFDKGGDRPFRKPFRDRDSGGEGRSLDKGDRPYKKPYEKREGGFGGERRSFDKGDHPFKKPYEKREGGFGGGEGRSFDKGGDRPFRKPFEKRDGERSEPRSDRPHKTHFRPRDEYQGGRAGRQSFGAKKGRGNFDRRPTRARDFQLDDDDMDAIQSAPASPETLQKLKSDRPGYGSPSSAFLYGVHAVTAALKNPKRLHQRLLVTTKGFEAISEAYEAAQADGLTLPQPTYVEALDIERLLPRDAVHQGLLLDSQPLEDVFLQDILISAPDDAKILVLDQVTDPHNVGAILRSASAFGAVAVVVQKLHAPDITGTLAKSASGAVEHIPVVREVNLTRAIEQLKEAGYFCVGLAEEGKSTLSELHSKGKVALVLGAEGEGLRRLVAETCDTLAKLPTGGPISSLNVSNAAAVALYELIREA